VRDAIVQVVADHRRRKHVRHSTNVIGVIVRCDDQVQRIVVVGAEVGYDGPRPSACVNQDFVPLGRNDERCVALSDVKKTELKPLPGEQSKAEEETSKDEQQYSLARRLT
jgi:hypothetical protein